MADIKMIPLYNQGQLFLVPKADIYSPYQLETFLNTDFSRLGHSFKRVSILSELKCDQELTQHGLVKIYNQYLGTFVDTQYSAGKKIDVEFDIYKYADLIDAMMDECSLRLPQEFDYNGRDPEWYSFGDVIFIIHDRESRQIAGFCTASSSYRGLVNLNLLYVRPEFRRKGYAKALLEAAYLYGLKNWNRNSETHTFLLKITTDVTVQNSLNKILQKLGFRLYKTLWRTQ